MSTKEGITRKLQTMQELDSEIATALIENPHCLDGDSQKEKAYRIAISHFEEKQKGCKVKNPDGYILSMRLQKLISEYVNEEDITNQIVYAREIALYVLQSTEDWLKLIPDTTKDIAFQIIFQYLEMEMCS